MGIPVNAPAKAGPIERISSHSDPDQPLKRNEQLVLDALRKSDIPLKAYDLLDELQDHGLRAPMTIYRALEALMAKGWVRKIASLNAFIAVRPDREPCVSAFVICRDCTRVKEVRLDEEQVTKLFAPLEVSANNVRLEALGECHEACGGKCKT